MASEQINVPITGRFIVQPELGTKEPIALDTGALKATSTVG